MAAPSRIRGHWDDTLDEGPVREPSLYVAGHKVYRKESCTLDHKPVGARRYMGLWQCRCCNGIIAPGLRKVRTLTIAPFKSEAHGNGNGHSNGNGKAAA